MYVYRTYCEVIQELRDYVSTIEGDLHRTTRGVIRSSLEELQIYGNRMEAALTYSRELTTLHNKEKKLTAKVDELKKTVKELEDREKKAKKALGVYSKNEVEEKKATAESLRELLRYRDEDGE